MDDLVGTIILGNPHILYSVDLPLHFPESNDHTDQLNNLDGLGGFYLS